MVKMNRRPNEQEDKEKGKGWRGTNNGDMATDEAKRNPIDETGDKRTSKHLHVGERDKPRNGSDAGRRKQDVRRPKTEQYCWYGENCERKDCWFKHDERKATGEKGWRNESRKAEEYKQKAKSRTGKENYQKVTTDETHFLEETVARIVEKLMTEMKKNKEVKENFRIPLRRNQARC
jgi:hypothetical protein